MVCPKCGTEAGESKFCPECGEKMLSTSEESSVKKENPVKEENNPAEPTQTANSDNGNQADAYYEALKKIEDEKAQKKKKTRKKRRIGCSIIILIPIILLLIFAFVSQINTSNEIKDAIINDDGYSSLVSDNLESRSITEDNPEYFKVNFKWGKYSYKKGNPDAGKYFIGNCLKTDDETQKQKAIEFLTDSAEKYADDKSYLSAISCIELLLKNGDKYDTSVIPGWAEECAKSDDCDDYIAIVEWLDNNEISYDDSLKEYIITFADKKLDSKNYEEAYELYKKYDGETDCSKNEDECAYYLGVDAFKDNNYRLVCNYLERFNVKNSAHPDAQKLYLWSWTTLKEQDSITSSVRSSLKSRLKDPSSYEEAAAIPGSNAYVTKNGDKTEIDVTLSCLISYSATNSFGARVSDTYSSSKTYEQVAVGLSYDDAEKLISMSSDELLKSVGLS